MKLIPKLLTAWEPISLRLKFDTPWTRLAREEREAEEKAYQEAMNTPYYKTHPKPSKEEWKRLQLHVPVAMLAEIILGENVSEPVRAINNYVREFKYDVANNNIPKGKYVWPAFVLGASGVGSFLSAPVTTTATVAGGYLGGQAVDAGMKLATDKTWSLKMKDWTGLDEEAGVITNPGVLAGGSLPLINRGYRTLLSAGDLIVNNAAKDFIHYGPTTIIRNPKGWYRPYVDQVRNGWQGWKDMRLAQRNQGIRTDIDQPYFESYAKRTGKFDGSYPVSKTKVADFYKYPEYQEGIGEGVYAKFTTDEKALFGVSQEPEMPNTYLFHIGGGGERGPLNKASWITLERMKKAVPKYSYIGDTETPSTGLIGMRLITLNGRTPTLGELIKASRMSVIEESQPLSANSTNMLLSGRNGQLRYTNEYMPNFNGQSLAGYNNVTSELINTPDLSNVNNFLKLSNPKARSAFIGLDGRKRIPIPINFKIE